MQQYMNIIIGRYPCIPKTLENGIYGPEMQNTVRAYQNQFGLLTDGMIGANTWNRVMSVYNNMVGGGKPEYPGYLLSPGLAGNDVLTAQRNLNRAAADNPYEYKVTEDGIYGESTKNAAMSFQRQNGLMADGNIDTQTWNKIYEAANSRSNGNNNCGANNYGTNNYGTNNYGTNNYGTNNYGTNYYGTNNGIREEIITETIPERNTGMTSGFETEAETVTTTNDNVANESEVFSFVNQQRANNGLSPLIIDPELQNVARIKARDMADNNYFSHTSPTYGSPFQMLSRFGIYYKSAAENIAGNSSSSNAVNEWMNSPNHRENILNSDFTYTGIGVAEDPGYGKIYVQMFVGR